MVARARPWPPPPATFWPCGFSLNTRIGLTWVRVFVTVNGRLLAASGEIEEVPLCAS